MHKYMQHVTSQQVANHRGHGESATKRDILPLQHAPAELGPQSFPLAYHRTVRGHGGLAWGQDRF